MRRIILLVLLLGACSPSETPEKKPTSEAMSLGDPPIIRYPLTTLPPPTTVPPTTTAPVIPTVKEHSPVVDRASRSPDRLERKLEASPATMEGTTASVSWYDLTGRRTASGEIMDASESTFAHKTMAFGTLVEFCKDGKCIVARCTDRGPYIAGRTFDLSRAAFEAIAPLGAGVATVSWRIV